MLKEEILGVGAGQWREEIMVRDQLGHGQPGHCG